MKSESRPRSLLGETRREIDYAIGDDNICRVVCDRKVFDLPHFANYLAHLFTLYLAQFIRLLEFAPKNEEKRRFKALLTARSFSCTNKHR